MLEINGATVICGCGYNRAVDVEITDVKNKIIIGCVSKQLGTCTLYENIVADSYQIKLTSPCGLTTDNHIQVIRNHNEPHCYHGIVKNVSTIGDYDLVTLNIPIDKNYDISNCSIIYSTPFMQIDGSSSRVIYSYKNETSYKNHINKISFHIIDNSVMYDETFGGLSELTNGILVRVKKNNGEYNNIFVIKNNGNFSEVGSLYYAEKVPSGTYALYSNIIFNGNDSCGVVIELQPMEQIEFIIHDDLTGLTSMTASVFGHIVDYIE